MSRNTAALPLPLLVGTTFGHLSVTDPDDPTYDGPDSSEISLQQSSDNLFSFTVTGTQVFLTVAVSLSGLAGVSEAMS